MPTITEQQILWTAVVAIAVFVVASAIRLRRKRAEPQSSIQVTGIVTGMVTRAQFDEMLRFEFKRSLRSFKPVSILVIGVDDLSLLRDRYGQARADECLLRVGRTLEEACLRRSDLVARYGDGEFAVIMPGVAEAGAMVAAERMRKVVFDLAMPHPLPGQQVSVSIGAATIQPGANTVPSTLVAMADSALGQSRAQGGNRATAASEGCIASESARLTIDQSNIGVNLASTSSITPSGMVSSRLPPRAPRSNRLLKS